MISESAAAGDGLIGASPAFRSVIRTARLVASTDVTVLIQGETGTGKELLARAIHRASPRAERALVTVNCATLTDSLAESELFGHRKGAFTGAFGDQPGRIAAADGGTLLLDEIGEISPPVQSKFLRFLESGESQPVGAASPRRVDARVIATTNRDLYRAMRAGEFREDLFFRLNVVPLHLPPLRERAGDVGLLIDHWTSRFMGLHERRKPRFDRAARDLLMNYPWPGNVRELRNFCERMVILFGGATVTAAQLPAEIRDGLKPAAGETDFQFPESGIDLGRLEARMIRLALRRTGGNRSRAARLLGLSRDALLYRIRKHLIEV